MAETGHTDTLCVCDAGFPVPQNTERVDLAWKKGEPEWLEVCRLLGANMVIEKIYLAEEIKNKSPKQLEAFLSVFRDTQILYIPHTELKQMTKSCRAVIRTGEFTPFCNCVITFDRNDMLINDEFSEENYSNSDEEDSTHSSESEEHDGNKEKGKAMFCL
jgi:D-ribose pyranase